MRHSVASCGQTVRERLSISDVPEVWSKAHYTSDCGGQPCEGTWVDQSACMLTIGTTAHIQRTSHRGLTPPHLSGPPAAPEATFCSMARPSAAKR